MLNYPNACGITEYWNWKFQTQNIKLETQTMKWTSKLEVLPEVGQLEDDVGHFIDAPMATLFLFTEITF